MNNTNPTVNVAYPKIFNFGDSNLSIASLVGANCFVFEVPVGGVRYFNSASFAKLFLASAATGLVG